MKEEEKKEEDEASDENRCSDGDGSSMNVERGYFEPDDLDVIQDSVDEEFGRLNTERGLLNDQEKDLQPTNRPQSSYIMTKRRNMMENSLEADGARIIASEVRPRNIDKRQNPLGNLPILYEEDTIGYDDNLGPICLNKPESPDDNMENKQANAGDNPGRPSLSEQPDHQKRPSQCNKDHRSDDW